MSGPEAQTEAKNWQLCIIISTQIVIIIFLSVPKPPLLLKTGTELIFHPYNDDGDYKINSGDYIDLYCSDGFKIKPAVKLIKLLCQNGKKIYDKLQRNDINVFACKEDYPEFSIRIKPNAPNCYKQAKTIQAGFPLNDGRFVEVYDSCFDTVKKEVHFSHFKLNSKLKSSQDGKFSYNKT